MNNRGLLILVFFISFAKLLFAEKVIILTDSTRFVEPRENRIEIHEDIDAELNLQQILALDSGQFANYPHFYNHSINNAYWIKFVIDPQFINNRKWVLEILDSRFSSVTLYFPNEKGDYIKRTAGLQ